MPVTLGLLTAWASPAGANARLSVFYFHRTPERPDPMLPGEPDAARFERIVSWIAGQFRILPPAEACERLVAGALPSRAAVITFDDGYRDNFTVALPILRRHGASAAFFVATGFLGGGTMFNDRIIEAVRRCERRALDLNWLGLGTVTLDDWAKRIAAAERTIGAVKHLSPADREERVERFEHSCGARAIDGPMLRPEQVTALARAGMEVGGHTRSHPVLVALADGAAQEEIVGGRTDLAALTGQAVRLFAYPNGRRTADYDDRHVAMVRDAGYDFAFTTEPGAASVRSNPLELPRFSPWDRTRLRYGARALTNLIRSN
jgi:peptidoglycan/xylan/chitin deacetylase (PgdA/CDA1 family)